MASTSTSLAGSISARRLARSNTFAGGESGLLDAIEAWIERGAGNAERLRAVAARLAQLKEKAEAKAAEVAPVAELQPVEEDGGMADASTAIIASSAHDEVLTRAEAAIPDVASAKAVLVQDNTGKLEQREQIAPAKSIREANRAADATVSEGAAVGSEANNATGAGEAKEEDADALLAADVARIEAERREPLPEGSEWKAYGGDEIERILPFIDVIDASWLLKLAKGEVMPERKGVVPAWQDVPPEAKLSLATLRKTTMDLKLPIAVLSYAWAGRGHCDPTGALLRRLKPVLERMAHCCQHGKGPMFPDERPAAWGIIWDFMSLPQRGYTSGYDAARDDRTQYQLARFARGLGSINVPYGMLPSDLI